MVSLLLNMESNILQPFSKADKKSITVLTPHKEQKLSTKEIESDYIFTRQIKIFVAIWREDERQREAGHNPLGKNINSFKKKKFQNSSNMHLYSSNTDTPIRLNFRDTD